MKFLIVLLTALLIIDCLILILLVLVQLPKKEAGMALAFGSGASDALFGAGSGNALTKMTKYCGGVFFALVVLLSILAQGTFKKDTSSFEERLKAEQLKQSERSALAATNSSPLRSLTNASTALITSATNAATNAVKAATPAAAQPK